MSEPNLRMPRLHPRVEITNRARNELAEALAGVINKYDLTYGEIFGLLAEQMGEWARYCVRDERHPGQPDKPGGLADD